MRMRPSTDLRSALSPLGLDGHAELLARYARVEIGLVPDEDGPSRIGGSPDLPPDFAWPSWPRYSANPIPFLIQIDLEGIEPHDKRLPERGVLTFFASVTADVDDPLFAKRVAAHVAYFDDPTALRRRPHPMTADEPPATPIRLRAERLVRWDIPFEHMAALEGALPPTLFSTLISDMHRDTHALFPAPAEECVGPMPPFGDIALLRVHDDPLAGFHVGDASWITFSISELDLRARRFEAARASVYIG